MAPLIPSAKTTLSYPLYACDFDPLDSSRLVVGGGGGAGRTGVGNKITILDTSDPENLVEADEIELSKDEDNVTSLAVGATKGNVTRIYAGVNSDPADAAKGQNKHLRVFGVEAVAKGKGKKGAAAQTAGSRISEISRTTLFGGTEKDTYQRITRLGKPFAKAQVGAIATGLSKESEIVVFDATTSPPKPIGTLESNKETVDLDFIQSGENEYFFAYCDDHDIYFKKLAKDTAEAEPASIYITPGTRTKEKPSVPTFRALRFLTKEFIIMLANIWGNSGVVLQIFRIPPSGEGQCRLAQSIRLPSSITKATGLAVSNLTPPPTASDPQDYTQFVIAVAGHDRSISLFKVDLQVLTNVSMVSTIKSFKTLKNVHPLQITGLAFSNFTPPSEVTTSTPQQTLKLASVGVSNTVIVHTFPLFPVPLSVKRGQSKTPRYVIALPSKAATTGIFAISSFIAIALIAVFIQGVLEIRGASPTYFGFRDRVPILWQEAIGRPYEFPDEKTYTVTAPAATVTQKVNILKAPGPVIPVDNVLEKLQAGEHHGHDGVVLLKADEDGNELKAHAHDEKHGPHGGKKWEELSAKQKKLWERRLKETGEWAGGLGSNIFKGVVFSEIAGAIGQAVAGG